MGFVGFSGKGKWVSAEKDAREDGGEKEDYQGEGVAAKSDLELLPGGQFGGDIDVVVNIDFPNDYGVLVDDLFLYGGGFADGFQLQGVREDAVLYQGLGFGVAVFQEGEGVGGLMVLDDGRQLHIDGIGDIDCLGAELDTGLGLLLT